MHDRAAAELLLDRVHKTYDGTVAVDRVTLAIHRGELVSLLGPSGCGKTTTLRMVGGFIQPTEGAIFLRGRDVTRLEPHKRDTAMVFQSYALFPHLSVVENVAFGLRRRRVPGAEVQRRVAAMLELLHLNGMEKRLPRQLSGGQQQRVAVARALVVNPAVLLLDEPLSNLDAKLRASTRIELRRIQQELGLTAIFVTHDQEEAMAISDRIAVMNKGLVEQVGTTHQIYEQPATPFVATFIGSSNTFYGTIRSRTGDEVVVETAAGRLAGRAAEGVQAGLAEGAAAQLIVRAEHLQVTPVSGAPTSGRLDCLLGTVEVASYLGSTVALSIRTAPDVLVLAQSADQALSAVPIHAAVAVNWRRDHAIVFPA